MRRVFLRPAYLLSAFILAAVAYVVINTIPALSEMWQILTDAHIPIVHASYLAGSLFVSSLIDLEPSDLLYAIAFSVLFGMNITLLIFFTKMRRVSKVSLGSVSGIAGAMSAFLSFGCSACGSVFATAFLTSIGGSGLVALLPLQGAEFGIVGFALLLFSSLYLVRNINKPVVCPI